MIGIHDTSLKNTAADYFLYCRYSPRQDRGNCLKKDCAFKTGGYQNWSKRTNIEYFEMNAITPIPVYKPEFIGKRELIFRYGTIFITDSLDTEKEKDFSYLKDKKLYLKTYRNSDNQLKLALMVKGNYGRNKSNGK